MRMMVRADVGYNPDQLSAAAIHPRLSAIGHAVVFGAGEESSGRGAYDDYDPAFDQCRYTVKGQDLNHDIYIVIPDPHLHVNVKVIN